MPFKCLQHAFKTPFKYLTMSLVQAGDDAPNPPPMVVDDSEPEDEDAEDSHEPSTDATLPYLGDIQHEVSTLASSAATGVDGSVYHQLSHPFGEDGPARCAHCMQFHMMHPQTCRGCQGSFHRSCLQLQRPPRATQFLIGLQI